MKALLTILLAIAALAAAINTNEEPFELRQPNGRKFMAILKGDEFEHITTTTDGYTIGKDERNFWKYMEKGKDGKLYPTRYRAEETPPDFLEKGVRQDPNARKEECKGKLCEDLEEEGGDRRILYEKQRRVAATTGVLKNLVVLIRFPDHPISDIPSQSDLEILMNSTGGHPSLAPTGSVRDLFLENSFGKLDLQSTVADWVTVSQNESYYANNNSGRTTLTHSLIREALDLVEATGTIDFSQFDIDGDGLIDAIAFVHSGFAAEFGGDGYENRIWSHKGAINPSWISSDGVTVTSYHISPSRWGREGTEIGRIGVIAHETGHFLGLPDHFDTNGGGMESAISA